MMPGVSFYPKESPKWMLLLGSIMLVTGCIKNPVDPNAKYVLGEVVVGFKSTVSEDKARNIIEQLECIELRHIPQIYIFTVQIPHEGHEFEKCEEFEAKAEVNFCETNSLGWTID